MFCILYTDVCCKILSYDYLDIDQKLSMQTYHNQQETDADQSIFQLAVKSDVSLFFRKTIWVWSGLVGYPVYILVSKQDGSV